MSVSARHEFWIWTAFAVAFTGVTATLAALTMGDGGWALLPVLWFVVGLGVATWVWKVRQDVVNA
jgi:hypothetical protein